MDSESSTRFRKLALEDADAMSELETLCFSLPWSRKQCLEALKQDAFRAYGLWRGKTLLAYISFYRHPEEMEILNFAVLPDERRRGYGDLILRSLLQTARNMGMQKVTLETRESNYPAIRLYEKRGFEISGVRRRYYPDTGENALVYCVNL
ncbi:MAG: ribosomal protein S18-alanine N-acetyltransferase [Desulfovibrio sp.]|nr:ribosomal protein S18-alanine N-acetyltransferase [Desulfovibrio sp.]